MPPHHPPPHHFYFPEPEEERLTALLGPSFGRMAYRIWSEHGAPPEHRILIEALLALGDKLDSLQEQVSLLTARQPGSFNSSSPSRT